MGRSHPGGTAWQVGLVADMTIASVIGELPGRIAVDVVPGAAAESLVIIE